jgi:hypothetical protein
MILEYFFENGYTFVIISEPICVCTPSYGQVALNNVNNKSSGSDDENNSIKNRNVNIEYSKKISCFYNPNAAYEVDFCSKGLRTVNVNYDILFTYVV